MTASNPNQSATTRARDPRGGWLRATRPGRHLSRRLLPRRASTRTRQHIGWASGHGAAVPKVCRRRRAGRGVCARRWRRVTHRTSTRPANHRCASQCVSRRSATSASYRRLQRRRRQSRNYSRSFSPAPPSRPLPCACAHPHRGQARTQAGKVGQENLLLLPGHEEGARRVRRHEWAR